VAGDWRRPHNEELHSTYASPIKEDDRSEACSTREKGERRMQTFGGKTLRDKTTLKS